MILDNDHISVLQHDSVSAVDLRKRLVDAGDQITTSVITYEEQLRSWLSRLAKSRDVHDQIPFYQRLASMAGFFGNWQLVEFGEEAADAFRSFRKQKIRISSTDLKIASIAIASGAVLLSRNLADFEQVPGLQVENWLAP